jgi:hypothetical protein
LPEANFGCYLNRKEGTPGHILGGMSRREGTVLFFPFIDVYGRNSFINQPTMHIRQQRL